MKVLVAIPCNDMMHTDFTRSLVGMQVEGQVQFTFAQGSLVYDARNQLADIAIDNGFDAVLWLDSDMVFNPDLFMRMSEDLKTMPLVSAMCYTRKRPIHPVIYQSLYRDSNGVPHADFFDDWPDEPFEVAAVGFGAVMCRTELLRKVREKYLRAFSPIAGFGEDLSFCLRVTELGEKMYCDPRIKVGHVGLAVYGEAAFKAEKEARNES